MKIFKQSYVGMKEKEPDAVAPLAFLVPYEDNAAGRKRIESVTSWVNGYSWGEKPSQKPGQILDNEPMHGFRIIGWSDRWSTDNKTARILDPRGFMLEIYIPNLIALIQDTTIVNGLIDSELVWAREGANNALISIESDDYKTAWFEGKDLTPQVGDIVRDGKGIEYQYLGKRAYSYVGNAKREIIPAIPKGSPVRNYMYRPDWEDVGSPVYKRMKEAHLYLCKSVPAGGYYQTKVGAVSPRAGAMKIEAILGNETIVSTNGVFPVSAATSMTHNIDATKWGVGYAGAGPWFGSDEIVIH